jgi:hypothetical protein
VRRPGAQQSETLGDRATNGKKVEEKLNTKQTMNTEAFQVLRETG